MYSKIDSLVYNVKLVRLIPQAFPRVIYGDRLDGENWGLQLLLRVYMQFKYSGFSVIFSRTFHTNSNKRDDSCSSRTELRTCACSILQFWKKFNKLEPALFGKSSL